jgi:hypothetical protein
MCAVLTLGTVAGTATGVAGIFHFVGQTPVRDSRFGEARMSAAGKPSRRTTGDRFGREVPASAIPTQRNAADAYRVTEEQVHRARIIVARNAEDSEDCRQLLDMLGLIASSPDQLPPVRR